MNNYNFSTLNDKEFEDFSKVLLNKKHNLNFKSFARGRDKGIYLLHSTTTSKFEIVAQVKHYVESSYSALFSNLKLEVEKVKKLNPQNYYVITSKSLTAQNKLDILNLFEGFIKDINHIVSQEDLNQYLLDYPEIEKKYYKLWLSSVNILQSILNNAIESRSRFFLENISNKIKYYVPTDKINDANRILKEQNILLITGQPGIGKTTLAEILIFERAKNDYKIYKIEDIGEAEDVINSNPDEKQLFYFDDFLGANYFDNKTSNINESKLTSFVEMICNSKNKFLILTTRTIVYNRAINYNEKLSNSKINDAVNFELELGDYNKYEKALILYNHFYFNKLDKGYFEEIKRDRFYFKIIEHDNYTPRIIEFFSDPSKIKKIRLEHYREFLLNSLDKPDAIWNYSFNNQLEYLEKCLLLTLFTFSNSAKEYELNQAFQERLQFERTNNNQIIEVNQFNKSIKILLNGFVKSLLYKDYKNNIVREYQFLNPSLTDYLINYVNLSLNEKIALVSSSIYISQVNRFYEKSKITFEKDAQISFIDRINNNKFVDVKYNNGLIRAIDFLFRNCVDVNVDYLIEQKLKSISFDAILSYFEYKSLLNLMENCYIDRFPQTYLFIKTNFTTLINSFLLSIDEEHYTDSITNLFILYEEDYLSFFSKNNETVETFINNVLKTEEETIGDQLKYTIRDFNEVENLYSDLNKTKDRLLKELRFSDFSHTYTINEEYWHERIGENEQIREPNTEMNKYSSDKEIDYDNKIIKLFE